MREIGHFLTLAFDTSGSDFVRGVEVGRLWEQLKSDEPVTGQMHTSNAEMLLRIADSTGRELTTETLDDTWLQVHFGMRTS
jgi:hypothetical protein